jgi:sulfhydrogenase subunit beta (sulfur reductase)
MNKEIFVTTHEQWDVALEKLLSDYIFYAPLLSGDNQDYHVVSAKDIPHIIYNHAKPTTPLKAFFLPFAENLTKQDDLMPSVILGAPSCDLEALDLLDEIYLGNGLADPAYKRRRDTTIVIGTDCYSIQEHCHCTAYGIYPFPEKNHDVVLNVIEDNVLLKANTDKGSTLLKNIGEKIQLEQAGQSLVDHMIEKRNMIGLSLVKTNFELPDYYETGDLIEFSDDDIWDKYASNCVSCGACAAICPTCSCFLLIDRPGFEKLRHLDACQYPGFGKVAAGHDPLKDKAIRFRNRFMCKYVWKPEKFESMVCTGCGRCIEACIGKINKNELFLQLSKETIK